MPDPNASSRRAFFGQLSSGCGIGLAVPEPQRPDRAWIIVALGWEYNDEWRYPEGESPLPEVYYDKAQAEARCRELIDKFFGDETPAEFEIDWESFFPEGVDDESTVTWDEVRAAGFPDPCSLLDLTSASSTTEEKAQ